MQTFINCENSEIKKDGLTKRRIVDLKNGFIATDLSFDETIDENTKIPFFSIGTLNSEVEDIDGNKISTEGTVFNEVDVKLVFDYDIDSVVGLLDNAAYTRFSLNIKFFNESYQVTEFELSSAYAFRYEHVTGEKLNNVEFGFRIGRKIYDDLAQNGGFYMYLKQSVASGMSGLRVHNVRLIAWGE